MSRDLVRVPVPPGPEGAARLLPALADALAGSGPAIAPIPTVSATVSPAVVAVLLRAVRLDGPPLESDDVAVVATTSGSTGDPKGVLLTASQLTSMTGAVQADARPQWVAALPVMSMGGLNVLVRALAADREPVAVDALGGARPFTSADFAAAVGRARDASTDVRTSLVPAQIARLLGEPAGVEALRACTQVLVGGAALRPALRAQADALGVRLTSTYGATETAGGCVFDGRPLPGVRVVAADDGRLTVHGPCVALGYRADATATREAFRDAGFRMPDLGTVEPDGTVVVTGRADDVVVVRGVNVSTAAVEAALAGRPDVEAAAVVVAPGADGEPRLCAFVVARPGATVDAASAGQAVVDALGTAARPRLSVVDALPQLPGGKVDRLALRRRATGEDVP